MVSGNPDRSDFEPRGASFSSLSSPTAATPGSAKAIHEIEVFFPVATIVPYSSFPRPGGDPLESVLYLQNVELVIKGGKVQ